jgi:hypothetical protein
MPAGTVTLVPSSATETDSGSRSNEIRTPSEDATGENEWPLPATRTRRPPSAAARTIEESSSIDAGVAVGAESDTFPAQFRHEMGTIGRDYRSDARRVNFSVVMPSERAINGKERT